ncbi:MAG: oxidoreductase [Betaproteobacteria bacterium]|nr:oxidoreductase [Betaproteobacteria bacterium]
MSEASISPSSPADAEGLPALEARIRQDLLCLDYPAKSWVEPLAADVEGTVLDCALIGGGQFGVALAFGLKREHVPNVMVYDRGPEGFEGPWMSFARMDMLRTPKELTGPDLGVGSLTFRAWYEAQHGRAGWDKLTRIPRPVWMGFLRWYRKLLELPVQNDTEVIAVEPLSPKLFKLTMLHQGKRQTVHARTVVFCSGAEGSGARIVPAFIREALPAHLYAHTNDPIDFDRLKGKVIGLLGAGASAFDNAATALEQGAAEAHLCFRREQMPTQNPRRWMEFSGFLAHYPELSDAERWAYMHRLYDISQPPPEPTFRRATSLAGFHLHPSTPWQKVGARADGRVDVQTPQGVMKFDFIIAATGISVDLRVRPEFAGLLPGMALWGDRYSPPAELADDRLAGFPYLGRYCDLQEKTPGAAPWAQRVFTITRGATLSMGPSAASNSNMKYTAPRIVAGVTRQLFLDARQSYYERFAGTRHDELDRGEVAKKLRAAA